MDAQSNRACPGCCRKHRTWSIKLCQERGSALARPPLRQNVNGAASIHESTSQTGFFAGLNALSNFRKFLLVGLADAAEPSSVQQMRSRALQLCSQLQRAALLAAPAQQSSAGSMWPSDSFSTCSAALTQSSIGRSAVSSTGRTVLSLLESNREVLERMPQVGEGM